MSKSDTAAGTELYDIYLFLACKTAPLVPDASDAVLAQVTVQPPGNLYVGLPLADAQRYLRAIMDAGGRGALAPVRYRRPKLTPEEGLARARQEFERRRTPGQAYNPTELVRDEGPYWLYRVTRQEPLVEPDRIPGTMYFSIDKMDGHLLTLKEGEDWANLSIVRDVR